MTRCLIFGGNGFIGSHLAERLADEEYEVHIFDSFKGDLINISMQQKRIKLIKGDFSDQNAINAALEDVDYVFHFISTTTPATAASDPVFDIESNVVGSIRLFQSCIKKEVDKIIFPSSGGTIYGNPVNIPVRETDPSNPVNPYAIGKLTLEKYLHYFNYLYGVDYKILRYSNPYGERQNPYSKQGVISIFLNKIKNGEKPIIFGDGSSVRDYIYIQDAINATLDIMKKKTNFNIFNVGSGVGTSIRELIEVMSDVIGKRIEPEFKENPSTYIPKIILDISRVEQETGWRPIFDLHQGVERTWKWIEKIK